MTQEESEDIFFQVSKLEKQMKELESNLMRHVDLDNVKKEVQQMLDNMEQNMEHNLEKVVSLIQNLEEKIPKSESMTHGTQENVCVEQTSINKHVPRGFDSHSEVKHGWFSKGIHLPYIKMMKFVGKDALTWICQMEQFFDLQQVPTL